MLIHVVKAGENINTIASQYGLTPERIIAENELPNPDNLVVGQSIVILYPDVVHTVVQGDTLYNIANTYGVEPLQILQNNPNIAANENLVPGETIIISYKPDEETGGQKLGNLLINGYAYTFIDRTVLRKTMPFLSSLLIFTYGFTPEGELNPIEDDELIQIALEFNVAPIMVLAPMTADETFSNEIAHAVFTNPEAQNNLINNIIANMQAKKYRGLDIDFEFVLPEDAQGFISFIENIQSRLKPLGFTLSVALAPKTSGEQAGLLYTAHNYPVIGATADFVLLMTYEWGYTFGPPMATAPLNNVRQVLEYGVSVIPTNKILMGIPNYAYDWPLPFVKGQTAAESISNVEAIERAAQNNVTIEFDPVAQAPFYYYTNAQGIQHVVWFDDARSMEAKFRLIPEFKLAGAGIWQIMNFFAQMWLVVNTLFTVRKI